MRVSGGNQTQGEEPRIFQISGKEFERVGFWGAWGPGGESSEKIDLKKSIFGMSGPGGGGDAQLFPVLDLITRLQEVFIQQVCVSLEPADIARLAMTCTAARALSEQLYKIVCDKFGFKQTGTRSRPVPYVQIFARHLCVECWQPAPLDHSSLPIDLNGGSAFGDVRSNGSGVVWLCGKCRRAITGKAHPEKLKKGLPNTGRRFDDNVRRKIINSVVV